MKKETKEELISLLMWSAINLSWKSEINPYDYTLSKYFTNKFKKDKYEIMFLFEHFTLFPKVKVKVVDINDRSVSSSEEIKVIPFTHLWFMLYNIKQGKTNKDLEYKRNLIDEVIENDSEIMILDNEKIPNNSESKTSLTDSIEKIQYIDYISGFNENCPEFNKEDLYSIHNTPKPEKETKYNTLELFKDVYSGFGSGFFRSFYYSLSDSFTSSIIGKKYTFLIKINEDRLIDEFVKLCGFEVRPTIILHTSEDIPVMIPFEKFSQLLIEIGEEYKYYNLIRTVLLFEYSDWYPEKGTLPIIDLPINFVPQIYSSRIIELYIEGIEVETRNKQTGELELKKITGLKIQPDKFDSFMFTHKLEIPTEHEILEDIIIGNIYYGDTRTISIASTNNIVKKIRFGFNYKNFTDGDIDINHLNQLKIRIDDVISVTRPYNTSEYLRIMHVEGRGSNNINIKEAMVKRKK